MFAFPAARVRAGIDCSVRFALPALCALWLPVAAHADAQAETVLKKMQTLYQTAKSYKGTVKSVQSGKTQDGKPYTLTTTQQIRYKLPNMFWVHVSYSGGTGAAASANGTSQTVACDGKMVYQYRSNLNQYVKQPARLTPPKLGPAAINLDLTTAKMLPPSNVAGHAVYIIQVDQPMPASVPADKVAQVKPLLKVNVAIDKSNYYLLRVARPTGEGETDFTDQAVNGSLPDSSFAFVPPAGAKPFTPPVQGAPGAPGAPGTPPHK